MSLENFFQLIFALFLGALIGLEREVKRREAGFQTYSLVTLGACLFAQIAFKLAKLEILDPSPLLGGLAISMGFIGAGTIFKKEDKIEGLTTAAGLWVSTFLGLAVACGFYLLALTSTILIILILVGFGYFEEKILKR